MACATIALVGCAPATAPLPAPLDDAIAYVQLADPLASAARAALGVPITPEKLRGSERCPFDEGTRRFECAPLQSGALRYVRSYQLLTEERAPVAEYGPSVAYIHFVTMVAGPVQTPSGVMQMSRYDDATLGDLRALRQTLRGATTLTWTDGVTAWSAERSTELEMMSRARMPGRFPVGTIRMNASLASPVERRTASMTFDGSPIASMLLSFDGRASVRCRIDLQAAESTAECQ